MERIIEPRTAPNGLARRWEVVFQPGLRHERRAEALPLGRPVSFAEAVTKMQMRRLGFEAYGATLQLSLDWAHTWEGVRGQETFSLFIRPYVESAN